MYITAHRVHRDGSTGINAVLYLHRDEAVPGIDWAHPDVRSVADKYPGSYIVQRTEIPPGNNTVSSYLDIVAHDDIARYRLSRSLANATPPLSAGEVWHDGEIGYRFYCSPRHDDHVGEFELLRSRIRLLLRSEARFESADARDALVIEVSNDDTGVRYQLDAASSARVLQHHQVTPASLGVFFENRDALVELWGEEFYRAEIAKAVTGLGEEGLAGMGGVIFRDRDGLLSEASSAAIARGGLPGQIDGYWYAPDEEVPPTPPSWEPTGAILVRGDRALLLVPVEFRWCPMSEAAIPRYQHTAEMHRGETWTFLTKAPVQRFEVQMAESLSDVSDVARLYGAEAASRASPKQATVQVRLTRR